MKAIIRNFLAKVEPALDEYWRHLTVGQSTYIGIKSQVVRSPATKAEAPPSGGPEGFKATPENARELCT
jgi:hypothetical protein